MYSPTQGTALNRLAIRTATAIVAGILSISLAACGDDDVDQPETETEVEIPGVDEPELEVD